MSSPHRTIAVGPSVRRYRLDEAESPAEDSHGCAMSEANSTSNSMSMASMASQEQLNQGLELLVKSRSVTAGVNTPGVSSTSTVASNSMSTSSTSRGTLARAAAVGTKVSGHFSLSPSKKSRFQSKSPSLTEGSGSSGDRERACHHHYNYPSFSDDSGTSASSDSESDSDSEGCTSSEDTDEEEESSPLVRGLRALFTKNHSKNPNQNPNVDSLEYQYADVNDADNDGSSE